jgi:hypothetical protein
MNVLRDQNVQLRKLNSKIVSQNVGMTKEEGGDISFVYRLRLATDNLFMARSNAAMEA